jgi:hypothetical protein
MRTFHWRSTSSWEFVGESAANEPAAREIRRTANSKAERAGAGTGILLGTDVLRRIVDHGTITSPATVPRITSAGR